MTISRKQILAWAREVWGDESGKPWSESALLHIERFATVVAAAEREACAALCEELIGTRAVAHHCADAIRARGKA